MHKNSKKNVRKYLHYDFEDKSFVEKMPSFTNETHKIN